MHAPRLPKHGCPISKRCSTTSGSNGTAGSSRRTGGGTRDHGSAEGTRARAASLVAAMAATPTRELLFLWIVGLMCGGVLFLSLKGGSEVAWTLSAVNCSPEFCFSSSKGLHGKSVLMGEFPSLRDRSLGAGIPPARARSWQLRDQRAPAD